MADRTLGFRVLVPGRIERVQSSSAFKMIKQDNWFLGHSHLLQRASSGVANTFPVPKVEEPLKWQSSLLIWFT